MQYRNQVLNSQEAPNFLLIKTSFFPPLQKFKEAIKTLSPVLFHKIYYSSFSGFYLWLRGKGGAWGSCIHVGGMYPGVRCVKT